MGTYDYIIVGGGTAGCILAERLSASGQDQVLLLEAGGEPRSVWIPIPAGFTKLLSSHRFNWRFKAQPESNTFDRTIPINRGKGLGGSSMINGMIYVRGQPSDYDRWGETGVSGWDFATLEPYFRGVERYEGGGAGRGRSGPLHIEEVSQRFELSDAFIEAAVQAGYKQNSDYNGPSQEGFGYYQVNQRKGIRWGVYEAFLKPAKSRANLTILTGAHVRSLDTTGNRCSGVSFDHKGQRMTALAGKEVILAAGAVQTPQMLELSGIGQPDRLQAAGIGVRVGLMGVGENYLDHYIPRMNWKVKGVKTLNESTRGVQLGLGVAEYFLRRTGILTLATGLAFGFVKALRDAVTPDTQYMFVNASYGNAGVRTLDRFPGMTIGVMPLRPTSVGSIHLSSSDPGSQPHIRPNFLSTQADQECIVASMKVARNIMSQAAMRGYVDHEMSPGAAVQADDEWLGFARENGQTGSHPLGTARMGTDAMAVVDSRLRVHGISGLRIVDASVIPNMVSGNIHAAVMAVALRAADLIKDDANRR